MDTLKGQCFDTEKLELLVCQVVGIVGYNFRTMEGVVDQVTKQFKLLFSIFFKFRLTSLVNVFNHSFWKLYIKTINDLDPGLNLPE